MVTSLARCVLQVEPRQDDQGPARGPRQAEEGSFHEETPDRGRLDTRALTCNFEEKNHLKTLTCVLFYCLNDDYR